MLNSSRVPAESESENMTPQDDAYDEMGRQYGAYLESNVRAAFCLDLEHQIIITLCIYLHIKLRV